MPIKKGRSRKIVRQNIEELISSWKRTGRIGSSKPKTLAGAMAQASAIAYSTVRTVRKRRRRE